MNTDLWTQSISEAEAPAYPCPHCGKGILVLEKPSLKRHQTVASLRTQPDEGWDPDQIEYSFSCWLKCAAPKCDGSVAVVGLGYEEAEWDDEQGTTWQARFRPKFAWPVLPVFPVSDDCPKLVAAEIGASFGSLWSDHAGAAARLRVALEYLLDEIGVARRRLIAKRFETLSLHNRIELLSKAQPMAAANLMAIKWLGNTGSHERSVALEDLLKGYDIMEHAMDTLLGQRAKRAATLARDLTRRHKHKQWRKK